MHQHVRFDGGRVHAAQVYPDKLCKAICTGLQKQMEFDKTGQFLIMTMDETEEASSIELMNLAKVLAEEYRTVEENDQKEHIAWDDVSGAALDPKEAKRARREEIEYVHKMQLYDKVPVEECLRMTWGEPDQHPVG